MIDYTKFWNEYFYEAETPEWLDTLIPHVTGKILDLGCGDGSRFADKFLPENYTGVDISFTRIEKAKVRFPNHTWIQDDINKLSFPDGSFDTILSVVSLQHVMPEQIQDLAEKMKKWGKKIVMCETAFHTINNDYCFAHDYEKLFNITTKQLLRENGEGNTYLMIHT